MKRRIAALSSRALVAIREEFSGFHVRAVMSLAVVAAIPPLYGNRTRTMVLRAGGFRIGRGTTIGGRLDIRGHGRTSERLQIGERCWINAGVIIDVSDSVTIGDDVAIAHDVLILTNSHALGPHERRAGDLVNKPVTIGRGCWVGARCVILPGVHLGDGSVVAAGAVVTASVPNDTLVAGVPAKAIRSLAASTTQS